MLKKFELQPKKMNQKEGRSRMNRYQKIAIGVMLFVPLIFLIVSLLMDRWGFFLWSLAPSFTVGMTGFFVAKDK
ncbi:hypothetical protein [Anoxybacillus eryuanensis]|uniref:Uncharacterized protein n=2 Tax=Anoxybacillus tengchongensis TaxID=576944 RepID=A0A7X0DA76_9BACL|nr:hypothetical protein [Anoxybacillus tengchongensis]